MKKVFFTGALLALLVACNDDDSATVAPELKLVTASNTSGKISYTDLLATTTTSNTLSVGSIDADGIYYNSETDEILLASRTNNRLETYTGLKSAVTNLTDNLTLSVSSANTDFTNARETAVSGDIVVVTQDQATINGNTNKLFVYQRTTTGFSLLKTFTTDFKVWGIHIQGNDLYAVADTTGDLVIFNNYMSNASGTIAASKRVTIEGLTRTHGITYSSADNVMILTDVASAASATDGGLVIINNFSSVLSATANLGTIGMSNQVRIYGPNSLLGNPVDVAYDHVTNNIYVAERLNAGGQVLKFAFPTSSADVAPASARAEAGVSAVFLVRK